MGNKPNIFEIATKELSQDAFIAWLLTWSDEKYKNEDSELHKLGKELLEAMCGEGWKLGEPIESVSPVKTQWKSIDVLVSLENKIGEKAYLIIEDKIGAKLYNDLQSYKDKVVKFFGQTEIKGVYIKTGNFTPPPNFSAELKNIGFEEFYRKDLLKILETYEGENQIVVDFRAHWQEVEEETNSFQNQNLGGWKWYAWEGFYNYLSSDSEALSYYKPNWGYVPNKQGGFLCCYWHSKKIFNNDGVNLYLQTHFDSISKILEFRINLGTKEQAKAFSYNDRVKFLEAAEKFLNDRFSGCEYKLKTNKRAVSGRCFRVRYIELPLCKTYQEVESILQEVSKKLES